ncbi:amidohydrolase [Phaeobacter sp. 11ANDIMAR09]|uniref:amidohydrolase n=1 Tax=Phaeobacter sp. 11ANDIMAR09 TaxID=1225647 RepID=UPI0006C8DA7D|nr:amidohydrolase [Phaeobacter sp. 11ANDIMAR09]KPD13034.1 Twin-arginine translocation pathway signal [Phaeobacter sp. 11ANDIMAR09]
MRWLGREIIGFLLLLALAAGGSWYALRSEQVPGRLILTGGQILPMGGDPAEPSPEALLLEEGVITAMGSLAALQEIGAPLYDLGGRVLTPGLIEPHTHPIATALLGAVVDVSGFSHTSRAEVMQSLRTAADKTALTPWLVAYGWDPVAIADLAAPTLAELDEIAPERPLVVITQMLHEVFANSAAMRAAGISLAAPAEGEAHGIIRDAAGQATGAFRELEAVNSILGAMPAANPAVIELLVRRAYTAYAKAGYTAIGITGAVGKHPDPVGLLRHIGATGSPLRAYLYLLPHQGRDLGGSDDFRVLGSKFWMDGSPFTGGAAFAEAYEQSDLTSKRMHLPHGHLGPVNHAPADFNAKVAELQAAGHQIAVHGQGERAIDQILDAFEAAGPNPGLPHRLEHNALITPEQIVRAGALGVSLGFFVDHIHYYGDALPDIVGARADRYMPVAEALRAGVVTTLHGDHPASPIEALRTLRTAVERRSVSGQTVTAPDQALTRYEALLAMTRLAAQQLGQDDLIGSIEVGKRADFTLFNGNPLTSDWSELSVAATWKQGQPTHIGVTSWLRIGPAWAAAKSLLF